MWCRELEDVIRLLSSSSPKRIGRPTTFLVRVGFSILTMPFGFCSNAVESTSSTAREFYPITLPSLLIANNIKHVPFRKSKAQIGRITEEQSKSDNRWGKDQNIISLLRILFCGYKPAVQKRGTREMKFCPNMFLRIFMVNRISQAVLVQLVSFEFTKS